MISLFYYKHYKISYFILLTEITRSRDQFLSYETKTTTVRDQDQDRCKTAETKTETETTKIGLETYSPADNSILVQVYKIKKKIFFDFI